MEQAEQCLKNMQAVVEAAGSSMDRVVKVTVLLRDMDEYANVNAVYSKCAWHERGQQVAHLTRDLVPQTSPPTPPPRALPTRSCASQPTVRAAAGGRASRRGPRQADTLRCP